MILLKSNFAIVIVIFNSIRYSTLRKILWLSREQLKPSHMFGDNIANLTLGPQWLNILIFASASGT